MKNKKYVIGALLSLSLIISTVSANDNEGNSGYNSPITSEKFYFGATLENNQVVMKWNAFKDISNETLIYYKVVRSSKNANPVYPEDGYIKYDTNADFTTYTDTNPGEGVNYYRICAITELKNRYCSKVVKINFKKTSEPTVGMANPASVNCGKLDGVSTTYKDDNGGEYSKCKLPDGTVCEEWALYRGECGKKNEPVKNEKRNLNTKAVSLIQKFEKKLNEKFADNTVEKIVLIETAISKLETLKTTKPNLSSLIDDVITGLNALKEKYQGTNDIEKILDI